MIPIGVSDPARYYGAWIFVISALMSKFHKFRELITNSGKLSSVCLPASTETETSWTLVILPTLSIASRRIYIRSSQFQFPNCATIQREHSICRALKLCGIDNSTPNKILLICSASFEYLCCWSANLIKV